MVNAGVSFQILSSTMKYNFVAITLRHVVGSNCSSLAFIVELLIERRQGVVFITVIGVAGSDLIIDGGINLLMKSLILISLTLFPGMVDVSTYEGVGSGVFDVVAILTSLLNLLIKHLDCISVKSFRD